MTAFSLRSCSIKRNMSNTIYRMLSNAEVAETRLAELNARLQELKKIKTEQKINELTAENKELQSQIECAKRELIKLETANGKKQYPIPGKNTFVLQSQESTTKDAPIAATEDSTKIVKNASKRKEKTADSSSSTIIDIRKLDLRIGKIVDINKHPDADTLYVEKIDCGESKARTVVSGLVNHVSIEEMRDRMVMILCNLKPVKMRGVTSEAMVMCASASEKVEVLIPPKGATPGDLVHCEGFPREPELILNPKKKIFEMCAPDLITNDDKIACYKGSPLVVPGKGPVIAATLKGANVK